MKYLVLFLFIGGLISNEKSFGQVLEDFERPTSTLTNTASTSSGTSSPVAWTSTQANTTSGFITASGPFTNNSLTFNIPSSGTSTPIMSSVLTGSSFAYGSITPWEWTFLYQAPTSVTTADNNGPNVSGNDWRFYFNATATSPGTGSTYNSSFKGYYVTQDGNAIKFYYLCGNCQSRTQVGSSFTITPGSKYIIRAVRQSTSGGTWLFYVAAYTGPGSFPTTALNTAENDQCGGNYLNSLFQSSVSSSANNGIFQWDNLNFYQATITLSGLNNVGLGTGGNGIASFLSQGDSQKAVFGFKATALGSVTMTQADFNWTTTGSGNSFYFTNAKLYYSSADDVYTPAADDNSIGAVTLNSGSASISGLTEGLTNTSRSYFLVVDVQNYASSTTATASISLTDVKIAGNSPVNIPSGISGTNFTLPATPTTWTGATSTAWSLAGNWNGGIPTSSTTAIIPTGLSRYPVLSANQTVSSLSMNNASINLAGFVLTVSGGSVLANNSTITGTGASYLDITGGSGDRNISGSGLTVSNLKIDLPSSSNSLILYAPVSVTNLLTMSKGILPSGGYLTLTSTSSGSANVDVIPSGASITGTVNVQRYITGGNISYRGYRLLSFAISDPASSPAGAYYNLSYLKGSGTYLTGAANGGFDLTGNPTIYLYNEGAVPNNSSFTAGNYRAVTAINHSPAYNLGTLDGNHNMPVGNGFMFFYRGNNSTNATVVPSSLTLSSSGTLNQGQITVSTWNNTNGATFLNFSNAAGNANAAVKGFNLVGNPYASTIDWGTFNTTTSTTGIYAPTGTVGTTIYTINPSSHVYATYIKGGGSTNGGSQYIASGQGFFVQATASGAQLIFNESAKASVQPGTLLLNAAAPVIADQHLRLKLVQDSVNAEDIYLGFRSSASSAYVFNEDAPYLSGNGTVSLSSFSADNHQLAINFQPLPKQSLVIPINAAVSNYGVYQLNLTEAVGIPPVYDIWLQDTYLKDSLDLKHNALYSFNITADPASYNQRRFNLVIRQNPALGVHLLSFAGVKETADVKLAWTVENESNYTQYILQKSTDGGKSFAVIDTLTSASLGNYTDLDLHPITGANLYRLEQIDVLGSVTYSSVVTVMYAPQSSTMVANFMAVYPNPVNATLNLAITQPANTPATTYAITIVNSTGTVVKKASSNQPGWQSDVSSLSPGTYFIQVISSKNNQLVGKATFIKL